MTGLSEKAGQQGESGPNALVARSKADLTCEQTSNRRLRAAYKLWSLQSLPTLPTVLWQRNKHGSVNLFYCLQCPGGDVS